MPSIGNTTKPNDTATESWSGTYNQAAETFTMPERGRVVSLGAWFAGSPGNCRTRLVLWNHSTLAVLGQSAEFVAVGHSWAAGHVDRYERALETPVELAEGVVFYAGLSRHPGDSHQFTGRSTGAHIDDKTTPWPAALTGFDAGDHGFGSYSVGFYVAEYVALGGAHVRRSGAMVDADAAKIRRSGVMVDADAVRVRRAGAWVDAS